MSIREKQMSIRYTDPDTLKEYIVGAAGIDIDNDTLISENGVLKVADDIANTPTEIATVSSYLEDQKENGYLDGGNLLPPTVTERTVGGINVSRQPNGGVKFQGIAETTSVWLYQGDSLNLKLKAGTYSLSGNFVFYSSNKEYYRDTFTLLEDTLMTNLEYVTVVSQEYDVIEYIQLNEGSVLLPYTPYSKSNTELTATIDNAINDGFITRNLLPNKWIASAIGTDGKIVSSSTDVVNDVFIKVKPNTTYTISSKSKVRRLMVYEYSSDNESNFITRNVGSTEITKNTITTSATTNYIRVSVPAGTVDGVNVNYNPTNILNYDIQLVEGSEVLPYQKYAKSNVELTEELFSPHIISKTNGSKVTNGNYFKIYRIAKIIIIHATFQIGSATSGTEPLFTLNETVNVNTGFSTTGNDNKSYRLSLSNNIISVDGVSLPAQWYSGTAVFVEQ